MENSTLAILFIIIVIVVIGAVVTFAFWVSEKSCLESYSNFQPQWGIFTDCRIIVDGVLTPVDIVREFNN